MENITGNGSCHGFSQSFQENVSIVDLRSLGILHSIQR